MMRVWTELFNRSQAPVTVLPVDYHEVHYMSINERRMLIWLNVFSLIPLVISALLVSGALIIYHGELNGILVINALPDTIPTGLGLLITLSFLPLHEWVHGLMIGRFGHKPRYGMKWMVLFATSDGALFRRNEFIQIALAPLISISLVGGVILLFLPIDLASWIALGVIVNAAGAIGDLWMTAGALRFDSSVLIKDEEDSMRIFAAGQAR